MRRSEESIYWDNNHRIIIYGLSETLARIFYDYSIFYRMDLYGYWKSDYFDKYWYYDANWNVCPRSDTATLGK